MSWNHSLEEKITEGKVTIIRKFEVDFGKIIIVFENSHTGKEKILRFSRVINLHIKADCGVDYDSDMDVMAYRTLIGFGFIVLGKVYAYEIIVDDYIVELKCLNPVSFGIFE